MPTVRNVGLALLAAAAIVGVSGAGPRCWGAADARTTGRSSADAGAPDGGMAASNWEIMEWSDPLTVSVDTASIEPHAARVTARVLWDYTLAQSTNGPGGADYRSMVGTLVFDCATEWFGAAGGTDYSGSGGDGEAVAHFGVDPDAATLGPTEPGTIGNDLVEYVCAHVRQRLANLE
jgi:hypothetical protein